MKPGIGQLSVCQQVVGSRSLAAMVVWREISSDEEESLEEVFAKLTATVL